MPTPPAEPKIYHITHVDNLPAIIAAEGLVSDAAISERGGPTQMIGMASIKRRRLQLPVECHPGDHVGDHVPFYFCPRSIMLFVIHKGKHSELTYKGGQGPIVHLEADLKGAVAWADGQHRRWAFSLSNAGAAGTKFRSDLGALDEVNWPAVAASDFRSPDVKEGKQAEFLLRDQFPWTLISRIGVQSMEIKAKVDTVLQAAAHRPEVEIQVGWYF